MPCSARCLRGSCIRGLRGSCISGLRRRCSSLSRLDGGISGVRFAQNALLLQDGGDDQTGQPGDGPRDNESDQGDNILIEARSIRLREMIRVRHIDEDRDHADGKADPAADPQFFLKILLPGHLGRWLRDAGGNKVAGDLRVLDGLVRILVPDVLNKANDRHDDRSEDQGQDGCQGARRLLPRIDPVGRVSRRLPCASIQEDPDGGRGEQDRDQYAQGGLDNEKDLAFRHKLAPFRGIRS